MATTTNRELYASGERTALTRPLALNWYTITFIVIFALAIFTRFYALGARAMSHDESLHTYYSWELYTKGDFKHTPLMHGPILFHATAFFYSLFGDNDFSGRLYPALLGVFMVMSPLLFRRWLGRWGTILAAIMILISPLLMYYNRYIRHDTPSISSFIIMTWAILMYLNGPENQRRRAHWLYIIAATMIWNLGSKETAFFYIAFTGLFLTLYWIARMIQRVYNKPARIWFNGFIVAALVACVGALGMYIVLDITPIEQVAQAYGMTWFGQVAQRGSLGNSLVYMLAIFAMVAFFVAIVTVVLLALYFLARQIQQTLRLSEQRVLPIFLTSVAIVTLAYIVFDQNAYANMLALRAPENPSYFWDDAVRSRSFISWSLLVTLVTGLFVMGTLIWGLTGRLARIPWRSIAITFAIIVLVLSGLIIFEEFSHLETISGTEVAAPAIPGQEGETVSTGTFSWTPIALAWIIGIGGIVFLLYTRSAGWWKWLHTFPELDVLMVMGSLILPWVTAVFIFMARGTPEDFNAIAQSAPQFLQGIFAVSPGTQTGQVIVGFLAWLPLMAAAIVAGLVWDWKRWIVCALIFHTIFAFFFTTVFTNIQGLATGMIYSLQYWLEQQGERRGSQPQYYYLLVILPMYEFLPIIGSVLAMLAGLVTFWRRRSDFDEARAVTTQHGGAVKYAAALPADETLYTPDKVDPYDEGWKVAYPAETDGEIEIEAAAPVMTADADSENPAPDTPTLGELAADGETADAVPVDEVRQQVLNLGALTQLPFLLFVSWWALLLLIFLTLAGEKMPWLGTHMTTPMIFITAWYFGGIFDRIDFGIFSKRGWVYLLLVPLLFVGLFQVIAQPLGNEPPFRGVEQLQLQWTYNWIAALILCAGVIYGLNLLSRVTGVRHMWQMIGASLFIVLSVLTFRASWMASFINYDYATEFLVYAHATPGTKIVMNFLKDLSIRTTDGMNLVFAYDNKLSWPGVWYFREYPKAKFMGETPTLQQMEDAAVVLIGEGNRSTVEPLLEDRYQRFEFSRMWWPMMDYFNLTATRIVDTFGLEFNDPYNADPTAAQRKKDNAAKIRRGLFDIWWARDYTRYGQGTGGNFDTTQWPVSENMYMYVRRDFAAQIWAYGLGDGTAVNPVTQAEVSLCVSNWVDIPALVTFDTASLNMRSPIGIEVGNGTVYVAEDANNRIDLFTTEGEFIESVGQFGDATQQGLFFQRPNSVAIGPDGSIYVVDTWNYRIRKFSPGWQPLTSWGSPLTAGINAQTEPNDGFWGPRDAVVDADGNIYIADTGNKRVRVYNSEGVWQRDIGRGGSGPGQLDEPSGLAISADGRLFVADTWNRRISVFMTNGTHLTSYSLRAWYDEFGNRPYLAYDPERDMLYVTDPDAGRVLVLNGNGECLGAFGKLNRENPNSTQFSTIGGIAVDDDGFVYVVDMALGRVLKFTPFQPPVTEFGIDVPGVDVPGADSLDLPADGSSGDTSGEAPTVPEATEETEPSE